MSKDIEAKDKYLVRNNETPAENTIRLAEKGFLGGILFSVYPLHTKVQTHSFIELAGRCFGSYAIPFGLTAGVFGAVTSLLDEYRGKDKLCTNAAIGGFVAGVFYGSRTLKPWKAFQAGCTLGAASFITRLSLIGVPMKKKTEAEKLIFDTVYMDSINHLKPRA